jgi:formate-dependent nitrite reductase membrane component NrfD
MQEEVIISGRNIPNIDPNLEIWHWPIPVYLFLGGLAAGILFFTAYVTIRGKEKEFPTAVKGATFIAPIALVVGLIALFIDLKHQAYFWRLYTTIRIESPMSWGAWVLLFITPLSMVWCASLMTDIFPKWDWKFSLLKKFDRWVKNNKLLLAWPMLFLALILGIYTGILLSAFNARPLWNNALLGPLFLTSGLSTGAATIMWLSKQKEEKRFFSKMDLILIGIEIFFIIHLFMGFLAGPSVQLDAAAMFISGKYALPFWGLVVGLGLILPAILETLELRGKKIPAFLPALLILVGGFIFRYIMVEAGQLSSYPY